MATVDELKGLYQAAIEFRKMSPWQWVTEHHLFAVQDPETKETGFCCITGSKGEHLALNVYLGIAGLKGYFEMLNLDHEMMFRNPLPWMHFSYEQELFLRGHISQIIFRS